MKPRIQEIKALTGIRGIAALWVIFYHVHLADGWTGPLGTLLEHGYLAVDLFFLLSGFVMALSYRHLFASGWNWPRYGVFLLRRVARIYPLYLLVLAIIMLAVLLDVSHVPVHFHSLASMAWTNLLMIQAWGFDASFNPASWSVSAEWGAYLCFPLFAFLALRSKPPVAIGAGLACIMILWLISTAIMPEWAAPRRGPLNIWWIGSPLPLVRCLCEFSFGLLLYRMSETEAAARMLAAPRLAYILTLGLIALLMVPESDLAVVALMAGLVLVLAEGRNAVARFCASRPVFFLGEISYALYLLHSQFMRIRTYGKPWLEHRLGITSFWADVIALSALYGSLIALSALAYWYYEKPCRRWIRHAERWIPGAERDPLLRGTQAR